MADELEAAKRGVEVATRPGKTAPVPMPPGLHEFSKAPYALLSAPKKSTEKPKSEIDKSLEWNEQQRKVAEQQ
jgi:hypothetical protein